MRLMKKEINNKACPEVSIVMCVYNGERFLKEAIQSVLSQTFRDFEYIIWDDGSTDGSKAIVESFKDDRIRYFYHENTGLGKALNMACSEAVGKYIARMDDDDVCLPNRLQTEYDFLESHPDHVLVSTPAYYINETGEQIGQSFLYTKSYLIKNKLLVSSCIDHPSVMFRTEAYRRTQGYPNARRAQDRLFWSKLSRYGKFVNFVEPLIKYRMITDSLSHKRDENSVYYKLMMILGTKIVMDDNFQEEDLRLYNELYAHIPLLEEEKCSRYKPHVEERFHGILSKICGDRLARRIVVATKNIYGYYEISKIRKDLKV